MTPDQNPANEASTLPSDDGEGLAAYYQQAMARMLHEYDQRDRDFATHVTVNVSLFAAVGFASQLATACSPISWLAAGLTILGLCILGTRAASALFHSIVSFKHWQIELQCSMAKLERGFLPQSVQGIYQRVVELGHRPSGKPPHSLEQSSSQQREVQDLVDARQALASALVFGWRLLLAVALVASVVGVVAVGCEAFATTVQNHLHKACVPEQQSKPRQAGFSPPPTNTATPDSA